jgi:hypothetical protein
LNIFSNRLGALLEERKLIIEYKNDPLCRNYMIPNATFHFSGLVVVKDKNNNNIVISNTDPLYLDGTYKCIHLKEGNGMYGKCNRDI